MSVESPLVRWMVVAWIVLNVAWPAGGHAQVPSNVLLRVLQIEAGGESGTAFTLEVDGRQYLVTAKHVVAKLKPQDTIQVFKDKNWLPIKVKVVLCDDPIDIAILIPPAQLTAALPLEGTSAGMLHGQDAYFLGFPYRGKFFTETTTAISPYPVAFIKRATISAIMKEDNDAVAVYLDGHNNPGFSGGPVDRDLNATSFVFRVAAVVSGFQSSYARVVQPKEISRAEITPEDRASGRVVEDEATRKMFRLHPTDQLVAENTGIVKAYGIKHAVDLIRKNPSGPKISN
jgi:hypothetical protein